MSDKKQVFKDAMAETLATPVPLGEFTLKALGIGVAGATGVIIGMACLALPAIAITTLRPLATKYNDYAEIATGSRIHLPKKGDHK